MHPTTVKLVKMADHSIKEWKKMRRLDILVAVLNGELCLVNLIDGWVDEKWIWFFSIVSFACVCWMLYNARKARLRQRYWEQLRRDVMLFDASHNLSQAILYMDQVEATLQKL